MSWHGPMVVQVLNADDTVGTIDLRAVRNQGQTYAIDKRLWMAARDWRLDLAAVELLEAEARVLHESTG